MQVKVLHLGEPFGEMALLTNRMRTATVKAETDCEVLRLDRSSFLDLVRDQPSAALSIAATLSHRPAGMLDQSGDLDPTGTAPPRGDGRSVAAATETAHVRAGGQDEASWPLWRPWWS